MLGCTFWKAPTSYCWLEKWKESERCSLWYLEVLHYYVCIVMDLWVWVCSVLIKIFFSTRNTVTAVASNPLFRAPRPKRCHNVIIFFGTRHWTTISISGTSKSIPFEMIVSSRFKGDYSTLTIPNESAVQSPQESRRTRRAVSASLYVDDMSELNHLTLSL